MSGIVAGLQDHLPVLGLDRFPVNGDLGHRAGMVSVMAQFKAIERQNARENDAASMTHRHALVLSVSA